MNDYTLYALILLYCIGFILATVWLTVKVSIWIVTKDDIEEEPTFDWVDIRQTFVNIK